MPYIVIYEDPHSGYDSARGIARTPEDAFDLLREYAAVRSAADANSHRLDWSIWLWDALCGFQWVVYRHPHALYRDEWEMPRIDDADAW